MSCLLLIEDNQSNADMVIRALSTAGIEVRHCLTGLDGIRTARKDRPDMILVDFDLPDIDGRTLILTLKKQLGNTKAPPIVAVTARTGDTEKRTAERLGCSAFVSKPFLPEELVKLVQRLLTAGAESK